MEYDFSGISTEELKSCLKSVKKGGFFCKAIICPRCPFDSGDKRCSGKGGNSGFGNEGFKLFKRELNRRENMNNEMPKLEAGMIVELYNVAKRVNYGLYLHIKHEWNISLTKNEHCPIGDNVEVINIYESNVKTWSSLGNYNTLIWSKKSEKDLQIEELNKTIDKMEVEHNKNIEELKSKVKELQND